MEDKFKIDSHKLIYHVRRVASWLNGEQISPIYMEISPTGSCNHKCIFCSVDFMGFKKRFLDTKIIKKTIAELGCYGLKSIMFAGEGEPFLHRDLPEMILHAAENRIDTAITTNGVLMRPEITDKIIDSMEWIKISINAGTPATYAKIHNTGEKDFEKVLSNMEYAVKKRNSSGSRCALGMQILLIEENSHEVETLAQRVKNIGADYLVVKPYTHHYRNTHEFDIRYQSFGELEKQLEKYNSDEFKVIFRARAMKKWDAGKRSYNECRALPFWSYIDSGGNVWGCSAHLLDERFNYGSIYGKSFSQIWEGPKRRENLELMARDFDISTCKMNCRMDEINRYLDELKNLPDHVNFI